MSSPVLQGRPIRIEFRRDPTDSRGAVHGGAFLRGRRIVFDAKLTRHPPELARIFVHELFHFAWVRLGNQVRRSWEDVLAAELRGGADGELGWSAEWRKNALRPRDAASRTRRWREYCCESFCDTAAWLFARLPRHPEFTLDRPNRARRRRWFAASGVSKRISI